MKALDLIKERFNSDQEVKYVESTTPQKKLKKAKRVGIRTPRFISPKMKAQPHVFGSRSDGSYTKKNNEEPKFRRKMRKASNRLLQTWRNS